jgi:hypothetical protein
MATLKDMARVVLLNNMGGELKHLPIFDTVASLTDSDLTAEYEKIVAKKQEEIASQRKHLATYVADETAKLDSQEAEIK